MVGSTQKRGKQQQGRLVEEVGCGECSVKKRMLMVMLMIG
jgi:hypothetical protein